MFLHSLFQVILLIGRSSLSEHRKAQLSEKDQRDWKQMGNGGFVSVYQSCYIDHSTSFTNLYSSSSKVKLAVQKQKKECKESCQHVEKNKNH